MNAKRSISTALLVIAGSVSGAQTLETTYRTNGQTVQSAFEPVRTVLQDCSAVIQRERMKELAGGKKVAVYDDLAYGIVMSADGVILSKASELGEGEGLTVRVGAKTFRSAAILAVDPVWDVALVKIDATGLTPVKLATDSPDPERGTWVVANGATTKLKRLPQVGMISASAREISPGGGVMGISLTEKSKRLVVEEVQEESGAAEAGIKEGDVLLAIGGQEVTDLEALSKLIEKRSVGEEVEVAIERKDEKLTLNVQLGEELTRNDAMSGNFSERRNGFPRVIQHDIIANNSTVGGPVLDLDGRCLGMNIARANRSETFAIPAGDLRSLTDRLMTQAGVK